MKPELQRVVEDCRPRFGEITFRGFPIEELDREELLAALVMAQQILSQTQQAPKTFNTGGLVNCKHLFDNAGCFLHPDEIPTTLLRPHTGDRPMPNRVSNKRLDPWLSWSNSCSVTKLTGPPARDAPTCAEVGAMAKEIKDPRDKEPLRVNLKNVAAQAMRYTGTLVSARQIRGWLGRDWAMVLPSGGLAVDDIDVDPGDWIIRDGSDELEVLTDEAFHDHYEITDDQ